MAFQWCLSGVPATNGIEAGLGMAGCWAKAGEMHITVARRAKLICVRMMPEYYNARMSGRECYHCKQWIEAGEFHDCWTTTEAALTADLSDDLREAWERIRETAVELGEQRIYASGSCIMFARGVCYCFVRPKRSYLEVCVFLGRAVKGAQVRRVEPTSKTKMANLLKITHRDQVEAPVTDWLREAYELLDQPRSPARPATAKKAAKKAAKKVTPAPKKKAQPARLKAKRA